MEGYNLWLLTLGAWAFVVALMWAALTVEVWRSTRRAERPAGVARPSGNADPAQGTPPTIDGTAVRL